jgi:putative FmdB family regulatory protein
LILLPAGVESGQFESRQWEVAMPVYEYVCLDCKRKFSEVKPITEYDPKAVNCPKCDSKKVERRLSNIYVDTSKKS